MFDEMHKARPRELLRFLSILGLAVRTGDCSSGPRRTAAAHHRSNDLLRDRLRWTKSYVLAMSMIVLGCAVWIPPVLAQTYYMNRTLLIADDVPQGFAVGDVDNDGQRELVVCMPFAQEVRVFNSRHELKYRLNFSGAPKCVAIGDTDGDGRNELIVGTSGWSSCSSSDFNCLIGGLGDLSGPLVIGEVSPLGMYTTEWKSPEHNFRHATQLALGDLNGNGKLELIVGLTWYERALIAYEFDGTTYREVFRDPVGSDVNCVVMSGDRLLVGTANWSDWALRVYRHNQLVFHDPAPEGENFVTSGDVNGDGQEEIVRATLGPIPWFRVYAADYEISYASPSLAGVSGLPYVSCGNLWGSSAEEIVIGTGVYDSPVPRGLHVFERQGSEYVEVWRRMMPTEFDDILCVGVEDLAGDGRNELYVSSSHGFEMFAPLPEGDSLLFTEPSFSVREDQPLVALDIFLIRGTNTADKSVSVDYATLDGTARAGQDYGAVSGTLHFAAGETNKQIRIPILDDGLEELEKQFHLVLSNPTGGVSLGNSNVVIRIQDNELLFYDDFESYPTGSFPGNGWTLIYEGAGMDQQQVQSSPGGRTGKALHLIGVPGWCARAYRPVELPPRFVMECLLYSSEGSGFGGYNPTLGPWGDHYAGVALIGDQIQAVLRVYQNLSGIDLLYMPLVPYVTDTWYRIRSVVDLASQSFDVYVDGQLVGQGLPIMEPGLPLGVEVSTGESFWVDEVKVVSAVPQPPLSLQLDSSGDMMTLSWPPMEGIRLQMSVSLSLPDWQDVPGTDKTNRVTLPTGTGNGFFRLSKP